MITVIPDLLTGDEVEQVASVLMSASFEDGRTSAGEALRPLKNNLQLHSGMAGYDSIEKTVREAISRNILFHYAVRPVKSLPTAFNRYERGMAYGAHIDDPFVYSPNLGAVRTDISYTLFLSDLASYKGGELIVMHAGLEQSYKLPHGSMVAYPSGQLHRVAPVTEGTRLAAVGWVQSAIRDSDQRQILFDLEMAKNEVYKLEGKSEAFDQLTRSVANLMRLWAEG